MNNNFFVRSQGDLVGLPPRKHDKKIEGFMVLGQEELPCNRRELNKPSLKILTARRTIIKRHGIRTKAPIGNDLLSKNCDPCPSPATRSNGNLALLEAPFMRLTRNN